jgi:hypothetical protein
MTHGQDHRGDEASTHRLEQIFTIGACGALAGVFILDWYSGKLGFFIKDKYSLLVLTSALLLLGLVAVRAVAVWLSVEVPGQVAAILHYRSHFGQAATQQLAQSKVNPSPLTAVNSEPFARDHHRDHGRALWHYVVLLLPVALSLLVPAEGLSDPGPPASPVTLSQLEHAALSEDLRADYEGRTVRLVGRYIAQDGEHFTLVRFASPAEWPRHHLLKATVTVDFSRTKEGTLDARLNNKWVEVIGQVEFRRNDDDRFVPTIVIRPTSQTKLSRLVQEVARPADSPF